MMARVLTRAGIASFRSYLEALRSNPLAPLPTATLSDEVLSAPGPAAELSAREFSTRQDMAEYLHSAFGDHGQWGGGLLHHQGLWAWLALFYFDSCCPADQRGARRPKEDERYIPPELTDEGAFRKYYRHLLAGPYTLFRNHGRFARVFLTGPVHIHPDVAEQVASRIELATNTEICKLVDTLYFDSQRSEPKRGATNHKRPGTLRRLIRVLQQFDLTFDLYGMTSDELTALLPREFDRFQPPRGS